VAGLEHLWAGWRSAYVADVATGDPGDLSQVDGSLFERILRSGLPDEETFVVHRTSHCAALLNAYPYTNGHLLVLPIRAVAELDELDTDEHDELWNLVRDAVAALRDAYHCDGVNIGMNLGRAAGAGVPDHLHAHVLPRWAGDTNFMTATADTRVLPESLGESWRKLRAAWPSG
jgi:ATP adenylyltransferase